MVTARLPLDRTRAPSRAMAERAPAERAHAVRLRGPGGAGGPVVLERMGDDFVQALLDDLADRGGLAAVLATRARAERGGLALYQPVHRVHHLVLLEAVCAVPGEPRLDPRRIEAAGLVVRRVATDGAGRPVAGALDGWMREAPTARSRASGGEGRTLRGWVRFAGRAGDADLDLDPDPARRALALRSGHPEIDRRLAAAGPVSALAEQVSPLFVAPPEVCAAAGATLLYGLVPVTSGEQGALPDVPPAIPAGELAAHLPGFLRAGLAPPPVRPGEYLRREDVASPTAPDDVARLAGHLRQLAVELGLLDDGAQAGALRLALDAVTVVHLDHDAWPAHRTGAALAQLAEVERLRAMAFDLPDPPGIVRRALGEWLAEAARVLVLGEPEGAAVRLPVRWPAPTAAQAAAVLQAAQQVLAARLATIVPREGRYDDAARQYRLRAFVRLRDAGCACGCARLAWSDLSEPFTIRPWHAASPAPPTMIALPEMTRALRPSVAFRVPKATMDLLNANRATDLAGGKGKAGGGVALDWICSFNVPVITLCAFIVLNVFLSLLDVVFRWLAFVKICLPVPRRSS